jgi:hypothetical protein
MKKSNRVALNIANLSDDALIAKAQFIIATMTDNANFPAPVAELDALKTAATNYEQASANQQPGSREDTFHKNEARTALELAFRLLATYVEVKSANDMGMLLSSGFDPRKTPTPRGLLDKPASLQIDGTKKSGMVKLIAAKVPGASSYLFQYAIAPVTDESQWRTIASTSRTKMIDNLVPGKQYTFRVSGVGADPTVVHSDEVMRYVA